MKLNKKILWYEVISILTGCVGCVILGIFLIFIMFGKLPLMLDLIWLSSSFILLFIFFFSNKRVQKLQMADEMLAEKIKELQ